LWCFKMIGADFLVEQAQAGNMERGHSYWFVAKISRFEASCKRFCFIFRGMLSL
jgi:hypothetical protein